MLLINQRSSVLRQSAEKRTGQHHTRLFFGGECESHLFGLPTNN